MVACTHEQGERGEARAGGIRKRKEKTANAPQRNLLRGELLFPPKRGRRRRRRREEATNERPLNRGPRNWLIGAPVIALMRLAGATAAKSSSPKNAMRQVEAQDSGARARAVNNMNAKNHLLKVSQYDDGLKMDARSTKASSAAQFSSARRSRITRRRCLRHRSWIMEPTRSVSELLIRGAQIRLRPSFPRLLAITNSCRKA